MRNLRGNTLLIELTVVILFFAVSQAIVLQVFAKAQQMNRDSALLNRALVYAENTAETLAVSDDVAASLTALGFLAAEDGYVAELEPGCRITATVADLTQPSGVLHSVSLTAYQKESPLFTIPIVRYGGGGHP